MSTASPEADHQARRLPGHLRIEVGKLGRMFFSPAAKEKLRAEKRAKSEREHNPVKLSTISIF
jgi:hypothetical protein